MTTLMPVPIGRYGSVSGVILVMRSEMMDDIKAREKMERASDERAENKRNSFVIKNREFNRQTEMKKAEQEKIRSEIRKKLQPKKRHAKVKRQPKKVKLNASDRQRCSGVRHRLLDLINS